MMTLSLLSMWPWAQSFRHLNYCIKSHDFLGITQQSNTSSQNARQRTLLCNCGLTSPSALKTKPHSGLQHPPKLVCPWFSSLRICAFSPFTDVPGSLPPWTCLFFSPPGIFFSSSNMAHSLMSFRILHKHFLVTELFLSQLV